MGSRKCPEGCTCKRHGYKYGRKRYTVPNRIVHSGQKAPNYKDGRTSHVEHVCWANMMDRCFRESDPGFPSYGGRGITVCEEWRTPQAFYDYLGRVLGPRPEGMTLDRIDVDGNYEPGNVRWASRSLQNANRRSHGGVASRVN